MGVLCEEAAGQLGIKITEPGIFNIAVASGLIDAHAGGLGSISTKLKMNHEQNEVKMTEKLSLIAGTSACLMSVTESPVFIENIWGPYFSAMVPNLYLTEAGQSVSGKLIDHILKSLDLSINDESVRNLSRCNQSLLESTIDLFFYPDFHGNRSPHSNQKLKGGMIGETLNTTRIQKYFACLQGISFQILEIIEKINKSREDQNSNRIKAVIITGGMTKNANFLETLSQVLFIFDIKLYKVPDSVLLGTAMLARMADLKNSTDIANVGSDIGYSLKDDDYLESKLDGKLLVQYREKYLKYLKFRDFMIDFYG